MEVAVDGHAHVEEDLGRDLRIAHPADEVQDEAGRGDEGEKDDDPCKGVGVLAEEGVVDEGAGEEGDVEGEGGAGEVEEEDGREAGFVGEDVGEAAADFLVEDGHSVTLGEERRLRQIPRRVCALPDYRSGPFPVGHHAIIPGESGHPLPPANGSRRSTVVARLARFVQLHFSGPTSRDLDE